MSLPEFEGSTALVTGAGAGIGQATARAFAARGARVMASDLNLAAAEETAQLIADAGGEAEAVKFNATDGTSVEALVKSTLDRFGSLEFAHNNVGCGVNKPFEELDEDDFRFVTDTTFKSVFLGLRHQLPVMRDRGGGSVVNTASMAGISTTPAADIVYSASKAAVIQMTAYAARMFGPHKVRVNCIAPGLVATKIVNEMFDADQQAALAGDQIFKRAVQPEEVAASVMFLCSAEAAMITGMCLPVDGGINAIR